MDEEIWVKLLCVADNVRWVRVHYRTQSSPTQPPPTGIPDVKGALAISEHTSK